MRPPAPAAQDTQVLYRSASARVYRRPDVPGVVFKEHLGPDAAGRLRHEAQVLERLRGVAGVVQQASAATTSSALPLADYRGLTLLQLLRAGPVALSELLELGLALARAVAGIHRAGVIHRDICPANVVLHSRRTPVLLDFDRAIFADSHASGTPAAPMAGSIAYLAPEQTGRTGRRVDHRADLYSLGATLYEMATGHPPFTSTDPLELVHDHLVREPRAPVEVEPSLPPALSAIILRLLAKDPDRRYQSAEGLAHDLARLRDALAGGSEEHFALGEFDFPARLVPPESLVGRDAEVRQIEAAFREVKRGAARSLLMEGAAGVGKSALIHRLQPLAAAAGGRFTYGKFDQYQRDLSASGGVTQTLRSLGRLLLAEPADAVAAHRERILARLGRNAALIGEWLPEFALLLGEQPKLRASDPAQDELRLVVSVCELIATLVSPREPLVMVVDDLQWSSVLGLRVFEHLLQRRDLHGLLLVGAWRSGEREDAGELPRMLDEWRRLPAPPLELRLANLSQAGTADLLAGMLRLPAPRADALAAALMKLTAGNPFDTVEMVNALRGEGALWLDESGWRWDALAVPRFVGPGSVANLLASRVGNLPPASREVLECMSLLGGAVERTLLGAAMGLGAETLAESLQAPIEDGLLLAEARGDFVRFRHDRVQQAVLDTLTDDQRGRLQLAIASRLAAMPAFEVQAAQQYLSCAHLLDDPEKRHEVASHLLKVAGRVGERATHALAERFLATAHAIVQQPVAPAGPELAVAIDLARHGALYSLGQLDEADAVYAQLAVDEVDAADLAMATALQVRSLEMRGRAGDGLALGVSVLGQLGLAAPQAWSETETDRQLDAICATFADDARRATSNATDTAAASAPGVALLMNRSLRSAFFANDEKTAAWLLHESHRRWLSVGPSPTLVSCLMRACILLIYRRADYAGAARLGRQLLDAARRRGWASLTGEALHVYSAFLGHWSQPLEENVEDQLEARRLLQEEGDLAYACYTFPSQSMIDIADSLRASDAEFAGGFALSVNIGNRTSTMLMLGLRQFVRAMRGETDSPGSFADAEFDPAAHLAELGSYRTPLAMCHVRMGLAAVLFGDYARAAAHVEAVEPLREYIRPYYSTVHATLLRALVAAWKVRESPGDAEAQLAIVDAASAWMAQRADLQPANYAHLSRLLTAERAWAIGDTAQATRAYDDALALAFARQRPWHRAFVAERAGSFLDATGQAFTGRRLLLLARDEYRSWGAAGKVADLHRRHPWMPASAAGERRGPEEGAEPADAPAAHPSGAISTEALDLLGVLRASQALSSQTRIDAVAARVGETLAAMTGAGCVRVLFRESDEWHLLPPGTGEASVPLARAAADGLLPLSVFRYAERTREPLRIDDALLDDRFARDPYFRGVAHCSLLVVPIESHGIAAFLYLENRAGRAAFGAHRLDAVTLIAGQLAVSLSNALLYERLEERVRERTRQLEETQAELVAFARRAGKAEVANNVLHNVGNVLTSVVVSAQVVRERVRLTRMQGLAQAVALVNEHAADLGAFLRDDRRGRVLPRYLNNLVEVHAGERSEVLSEIDRLTRSIHHIRDIVATQQSHAGSSSVLTSESVHELLEEALHMCASALADHGVSILREFEALPRLPLDRPRLLQILVNLIGNGIEAMHVTPADARRLTIGVRRVAVPGDRLRITVRDAGEGIEAGNLSRIFGHGFTTKKSGHGFGLHGSALAALEMGGTLEAESEGRGRGATFILEVPVKMDEQEAP
ncbi:trifunctional serine/threonine-protein kinase/ATP-binding protein/sensor histidine kinase [Ramlibacter sp.]|uniref:trifunctional serine/threonine-protein kinase/ATP-binding protein/sensor histidine kinase n=1 Tax=Ramlibacter sp. TaxID=1917967 RepID=UPI003D0FD3CD